MTAAKTRSLSAAPPRRLERPARSRPGRPGYDLDSLLAVAVEVFNERGYDGTSMEDLARRLGITKSAIYHHVSGKEELLRLATSRALDGWSAVADQARAEIMVRTVGDTAELRRDLLAALPPARAAVVRETPAVRLRALSGFATSVVKFTTDIPRLTAWGEPLLLGPGSIHDAHTAAERVAKSQLLEAAELYAELVRRLRREVETPQTEL